MSNLSFDYLPVCVRPGLNSDRLDTSQRIVKTFAAPIPQTGGSIRYARTFAIALFYKTPWVMEVVEQEVCSHNDLLLSPQRGLGDISLPLVSRLGLEPRCQLRRRILSPI